MSKFRHVFLGVGFALICSALFSPAIAGNGTAPIFELSLPVAYGLDVDYLSVYPAIDMVVAEKANLLRSGGDDEPEGQINIKTNTQFGFVQNVWHHMTRSLRNIKTEVGWL